MQASVEDVYLDPLLLEWLVELGPGDARAGDGGASAPRFARSIALERVARAWALVHGRGHVEADDIEQLFIPVVGHRLVFDPFALADAGTTTGSLLERVREDCLERVPRPEPHWDE